MARETFHEDYMGDNVSVKSGDGDKGSGAVPSIREVSWDISIKISIEWLGKISVCDGQALQNKSESTSKFAESDF